MFFKDTRAATANTDVIRKREQKKLSATTFKPLQVKQTQEETNPSELAIKSHDFKVTTFKDNLDNLSRKALTSKFADISQASEIFTGTFHRFKMTRPRNIGCKFRNGKLLVKPTKNRSVNKHKSFNLNL